MPASIPARTRSVYFLGAGFSRAVGVPNTAELLVEVHRLAKEQGLAIDKKLVDAYRYFYPEEASTFVPDVVDLTLMLLFVLPVKSASSVTRSQTMMLRFARCGVRDYVEVRSRS